MGSKQLGVPRPINIHGALDDIVNWRKLILATYKLAKGGQNTVNQYGTPIKTLPNMEAIKFLFEHRFGRAEQRITSTHADKELLLKLSEFADKFVIPKGNLAVSEGGMISDTASTDNQ